MTRTARPTTAAHAAARLLAPTTLALLLCTGLLTACGGGDSNGGGPATLSSGFSAGTVTGKGSTIVNGVRFDDSSASVSGEDEDGHRSGDDVKVGMQVDVSFDASTCTATPAATTTSICKAQSLHFGGNALVGPLAGLTTVSGTLGSFTVLGQKVETSASTVLSLASGLTALANDQIVEVHGLHDKTSGITTATRIEVKAASFAADPAAVKYFRLRGMLDAAAGTIGGTQVDLAAVGTDAARLDKTLVRARLTPAAAAPYAVTRLQSAARAQGEHRSGQAEVEGLIADWSYAASGLTASFTINGVKVSASTADGAAARIDAALLASLDAALSAQPATPVRVEVHGSFDANGVLVASRIKLDDERDAAGFELHGTVTAWSATSKTFTLRGETVELTDATVFRTSSHGALTLATMADGLKVEVEGARSTDGTRIVASRIKLDD